MRTFADRWKAFKLNIRYGYFLSRKHEPLREVGQFANVSG